MAEWFFFISLLMAAIIVIILAIRRKNRMSEIEEEHPGFGKQIGDILDKID